MYWPGGKTKAFTLSYDDGVEQDLRLIAMLDRHGVKATFNLNPGLFGVKGTIRADDREARHDKLPIETVAACYAGHEVAAHGLVHARLRGADVARCTAEILGSRTELEKLFRRPITGYAFAYGDTGEAIFRAAEASGLRYARLVTPGYNCVPPVDPMRWCPSCHHDDPCLPELLENFLSDEPCVSPYMPAKLLYIWGHAYEFDLHDNWDHMENILRQAGGRDDVWYATNGEIEEYLRAFRNLIFTADSAYVHNPSAVPVWVGSLRGSTSICVRPGETAPLLPPEES